MLHTDDVHHINSLEVRPTCSANPIAYLEDMNLQDTIQRGMSKPNSPIRSEELSIYSQCRFDDVSRGWPVIQFKSCTYMGTDLVANNAYTIETYQGNQWPDHCGI